MAGESVLLITHITENEARWDIMQEIIYLISLTHTSVFPARCLTTLFIKPYSD